MKGKATIKGARAVRGLHIVQSDALKDKAELEKKAKEKMKGPTSSWIVPKSARPGDNVVIYVPTYGFFATAVIQSFPIPRRDWPNRYGAPLTSVRLIKPAISLGIIRRHIPELNWAKYPRSITTPDLELSDKIIKLIRGRRETGIPDLDEKALLGANIDELRRVASLRASKSAKTKERKVSYRIRSAAIKIYVLMRSKGFCESCKKPAPFRKNDGTPYLEPHHITRLADNGPDHPRHVIALCPNCHRKAHYSADAREFAKSLKTVLAMLEAK